MISNIKDLLEYYNINSDNIPEYVMEYEFPDEIENYGKHHTEKHDDKIIHVFTSTGNVDGKEIKIENILDLNEPVSWTEVRYVNEDEPTYHQTIIEKDYIIEDVD